jgi:hypothetical protein
MPDSTDTSPNTIVGTPTKHNPIDLLADSTTSTKSTEYSTLTFLKLEATTCIGITPLFDGTQDKFFPFLFALKTKSRYAQWLNILTIVDPTTSKTFHLFDDFTALPKTAIHTRANDNWNTTTSTLDCTTLGHYCGSSRLLNTILTNSIEISIRQAIEDSLDENLARDGPSYWHAILLHVFPSTTVFQCSVKDKLRSLHLKNFTDIPTFVQEFRNYEKLVPSTGKGELTLDLFRELLTSPCKNFRYRLQLIKATWQNADKDILPAELCRKAITIRQQLIQSNKWTSTADEAPENTEISALKARIVALNNTVYQRQPSRGPPPTP